jgi:hypothetical protein
MMPSMNLVQIITELRQEQLQIDMAIASLERLGASSGKRRGRPPKWLTALNAPKRRGRPPGSKNKPKPQPTA